jgi:lipid-binding SYLF domain-containing protein
VVKQNKSNKKSKIMKTMLNLILVSILIITMGNLKAAASSGEGKSEDSEKAAKTLKKAVIALDHVMEDPENSIPQSLINSSEGIVIFPGAFKIALGFLGGQGARGIAMIRKEDGSWSNPFFVNLGEGSLGFQIGAQASDIVLLFKDRNDIIEIDKADITLGGDVGVTAGPVNKGSSSITDITFESEIYSYYRSKGLFAGVSLKGGILSYNEKVSESLYGIEDISTDEIFSGIETPYNDKVNDLIEALVMYGE